jgi:hypothetical protein
VIVGSPHASWRVALSLPVTAHLFSARKIRLACSGAGKFVGCAAPFGFPGMRRDEAPFGTGRADIERLSGIAAHDNSCVPRVRSFEHVLRQPHHMSDGPESHGKDDTCLGMLLRSTPRRLGGRIELRRCDSRTALVPHWPWQNEPTPFPGRRPLDRWFHQSFSLQS